MRFKCPACLRKVHSVEVREDSEETKIIDRTCPKCKVKWRFKIYLIMHAVGGMTVHGIENTANLTKKKP